MSSMGMFFTIWVMVAGLGWTVALVFDSAQRQRQHR